MSAAYLGGKPIQHMPARTETSQRPQLKVSGMLFPNTSDGRAAAEEFRRTGVAPPLPGPTVSQVIDHHTIDPSTMEVQDPADLVLFQPEDVEQAYKIFAASAGIKLGTAKPSPTALFAIREVMLFSLGIASINLDVHPDQATPPA